MGGAGGVHLETLLNKETSAERRSTQLVNWFAAPQLVITDGPTLIAPAADEACALLRAQPSRTVSPTIRAKPFKLLIVIFAALMYGRARPI